MADKMEEEKRNPRVSFHMLSARFVMVPRGVRKEDSNRAKFPQGMPANSFNRVEVQRRRRKFSRE